MPNPCFKINGKDWAPYISELKPTKNDLDSAYSGRNVLDGLMYRSRIGTKKKWSVSFIRLTATQLKELEQALYSGGDYISITLLDPKINQHVTSSYYFSSINEGVQRLISGQVYYDEVTFNIIER